MRSAEADEHRDRARLHDFEAEELLVEFARKSQVAAIERAVREKVELQGRCRLLGLGLGSAGIGHRRLPG
jgi:hypothetical protein